METTCATEAARRGDTLSKSSLTLHDTDDFAARAIETKQLSATHTVSFSGDGVVTPLTLRANQDDVGAVAGVHHRVAASAGRARRT